MKSECPVFLKRQKKAKNRKSKAMVAIWSDSNLSSSEVEEVKESKKEECTLMAIEDESLEVSRIFHPNFSAKWRRYFYIFPLNDGIKQLNNCGRDEFSGTAEMVGVQKQMTALNQEDTSLPASDGDTLDTALKNRSFSVKKVNQLLHQLEGKPLSYKMFARDTKSSRSIGPPTECYLFHARAAEVTLPCHHQDSGRELRVMCVELVANRFLRRMVRVLVATSIREAAAGAGDDALLKLIDATCRRATAPPAPPDGLCLVDIGYEEFRREHCFIC
ncbi:hypothetical protein Taro_030800 [Colocasia esculenta]|uniref:tRNA pseudouridine synthase n=1 Tax=Colocasia esculenta TaxID=4460 RepID=A0A843W4G6_COLES|nr:hypothetical protein [Colocasia esculenta]